MPKRRDLEYHELGGKENLVTLQDHDGTFDRFRCINCDKEFRMRHMARPKKIYEPCYVSQAKFDEVMERRKAEVSGEVYGCWSSSARKCNSCGEEMVLCPREGHPNSKFWKLERDDGTRLFVCPNNCPVE